MDKDIKPGATYIVEDGYGETFGKVIGKYVEVFAISLFKEGFSSVDIYPEGEDDSEPLTIWAHEYDIFVD